MYVHERSLGFATSDVKIKLARKQISWTNLRRCAMYAACIGVESISRVLTYLFGRRLVLRSASMIKRLFANVLFFFPSQGRGFHLSGLRIVLLLKLRMKGERDREIESEKRERKREKASGILPLVVCKVCVAFGQHIVTEDQTSLYFLPTSVYRGR